MSVILNDVKIWRSLLQDIPDLYEDSDILKVKLYFWTCFRQLLLQFNDTLLSFTQLGDMQVIREAQLFSKLWTDKSYIRHSPVRRAVICECSGCVAKGRFKTAY